MLLIGIAVPLAALALQVRDDAHVCLRTAPGFALPTLCASRRILGIDCPACGLTRSVVHLVHGKFTSAWRVHRLGWLALLLILVQIPYRGWCLVRRLPGIECRARTEYFFWGILLFLLFANRAWDYLDKAAKL